VALRAGRSAATIDLVEAATELNRYELRRYLDRIGDRWPIEAALLSGARVADVHCYTPAEFERKRESLPAVRAAADSGLDLLALSAARHPASPDRPARESSG